MYTGNGVAKVFPLPDGNDGSVVVLRMPGGKGIRMTEGESYSVENGSVVFRVAVPSGVEVVFEELPAEEMTVLTSGAYVVIYPDGTMKEVEENPALMVSRVEKILEDVRKDAADVRTLKDETISYITSTLGAFTADMDARLSSSQINPEAIAEDAFRELQGKIRDEYGATLTEIRSGLKEMRGLYTDMQMLRMNMEEVASQAAERVSDTLAKRIKEECASTLSGLEELRGLKSGLQDMADRLKLEAETRYYEESERIKTRANEELEMLKSLRVKLEENYRILDAKISNRLELLGVRQ